MTFKVLIVEDKPDFREVLVEHLELKGCEATGFESMAHSISRCRIRKRGDSVTLNPQNLGQGVTEIGFIFDEENLRCHHFSPYE